MKSSLCLLCAAIILFTVADPAEARWREKRICRKQRANCSQRCATTPCRDCDPDDKELKIANPEPIEALNFNGDLDGNIVVKMYDLRAAHVTIRKYADPYDLDPDCDYCRMTLVATQVNARTYRHTGSPQHILVYGTLLDSNGATISKPYSFGAVCVHKCGGTEIIRENSDPIADELHHLAAGVRLTFTFPFNENDDYARCREDKP